MFQHSSLKSSQTSFLRGVMTGRGHGRDTQGLSTFRFFTQTRAAWVPSVCANPSGRTLTVCALCTHTWHINAQTENSSQGTVTKEEWPQTKEFPQQVEQDETIGDPWRQRNGEGAHSQDRRPTGKIPCSLLRKNPHPSQTEGILRAHLTTHLVMTEKNWDRERPRQNNLLKVRELVKDKFKCKSWVTSIKTTNYKMVKIFQKNELSNHPEWVRAQERTQLLSISFKWDKQWKATGAHNIHSRRDLRERGGEDNPAETGNTAHRLWVKYSKTTTEPHTSLPPTPHVKREHFACLDYFSLQRAHFRSLFYKQTTTAVKSDRTLV